MAYLPMRLFQVRVASCSKKIKGRQRISQSVCCLEAFQFRIFVTQGTGSIFGFKKL
jgi:hypothetical protein